MLKNYPKVQHMGTRYTKKIFDDTVEITEKLDGSQFRFGLLDNHLMCCSKGSVLSLDTTDGLFKPAVTTCKQLFEDGLLDKDFVYIGETLSKGKHNCITYTNVPLGHISLFAVYDKKDDTWLRHCDLKNIADHLNIDYVRLLKMLPTLTEEEKINIDTILEKLLDTESQLGGSKIEGFVVKNLFREVMVGDLPVPFIQGKFVSEKFKEKMGSKRKNRGQGWAHFMESYKTEARWNKSIQHLREEGKLQHSPVDIGDLIAEIKRDIAEECGEEIKDFLWKYYGAVLLRNSTHGFPEYYKTLLLKEGLL